MNVWRNIEISESDPEIIKINTIEKYIDEKTSNIAQIRELITRFEVCHFKCKVHIHHIKDSITNLNPCIQPDTIGISHFRHGRDSWISDTTGRSLLGQQYLYALQEWLGDEITTDSSDISNEELKAEVKNYLGDINPTKERLIRLLLARMMLDWEKLENICLGEESGKMEMQICKIEICHHEFPHNIILLLQGIGKNKEVINFRGCGDVDSNIMTAIEEEFLSLNRWLIALSTKKPMDKTTLKKVWLIASFAKTLKEQIGLTQPIDGLEALEIKLLKTKK